MPNCLVVCYSRSGLTARLGQELAGLCGADFELIREARGRAGLRGYLRAVADSLRRRAPPIEPPLRNPADYALVILGTPVWAGNMAAPMRSYLERYQNSLPRVALFCTMGGRGDAKTLFEMASLCGQRPLAALAFTDRELQRHDYRAKLDQLRALLPVPA